MRCHKVMVVFGKPETADITYISDKKPEIRNHGSYVTIKWPRKVTIRTENDRGRSQTLYMKEGRYKLIFEREHGVSTQYEEMIFDLTPDGEELQKEIVITLGLGDGEAILLKCLGRKKPKVEFSPEKGEVCLVGIPEYDYQIEGGWLDIKTKWKVDPENRKKLIWNVEDFLVVGSTFKI